MNKSTRAEEKHTGGTNACTPVFDPRDPFFCFFLLLGAGVGVGAEAAGVAEETPGAWLAAPFRVGDGLDRSPPDELARLRLLLAVLPAPPSLSDMVCACSSSPWKRWRHSPGEALEVDGLGKGALVRNEGFVSGGVSVVFRGGVVGSNGLDRLITQLAKGVSRLGATRLVRFAREHCRMC